MNLSQILGGSGHPTAIQKDRHALPDPVMPYPRPAEPPQENRVLGRSSGSWKSIRLQKQAEHDRQRAEAEKMPTDQLLGGLSALARGVAAKLGIELKQPTVEVSYRQTGRFAANVSGHRIVGQVTAQLILDCAKATKTELALPAELDVLRRLADQWTEVQTKISDVMPTTERVHAIMAADQARAGTPEFVGLQPDDARQQCVRALSPLKHKLSDISHQAATVAKSILPRALESISSVLGQELEKEIRQAEKLRMPFVPSVFANTLLKCQEILGGQDLTTLCQCPPRAFLLGLTGLLLDEAAKETK